MMTGGAVGSIRAGILLLCLLPALVLMPVRAEADAAAEHAVKVVHGLAADIWSSRQDIVDAGDRQRFLAGAIEANTDVDLLSRLVLGRHWRTLDPADRREYRTLFSDVVIGSLAGRLNGVLRGLDGPMNEHFTITGSTASGSRDVLVRSKVIAADGSPLTVDWRLRDAEPGPVIIDLVVEGVSLLVSQRNEFAAVIERRKIDGLIDALRQRAAGQSS